MKMTGLTITIPGYKEETKIFLTLRDHFLEGLAKVDFDISRMPKSYGLTSQEIYTRMSYHRVNKGKSVLSGYINRLMEQKLIRDMGLGRISINFIAWSWMADAPQNSGNPEDLSTEDGN